MALEFTTSYLADSLTLFRSYKGLAERAIAQVPDDRLTETTDEDANSIATIMKHLAGNMRSRWTDFLTSDGEKPDRNRDGEFMEPPAGRDELMRMWENGWTCLFDALEPLTDAHLGERILIRGEAHSVMQAINRQIAHYAYHIGQIVLLAKQMREGEWKSLSVPRNKSADFTKRVLAGEASQR